MLAKPDITLRLSIIFTFVYMMIDRCIKTEKSSEAFAPTYWTDY